jgi:uncharacterized radical SAM superfamily Fe-S cluster-containing enzyme
MPNSLSTHQNYELIQELRNRGLCVAYLEIDDVSDDALFNGEEDAKNFIETNKRAVEACMTEAGISAVQAYLFEDRGEKQ